MNEIIVRPDTTPIRSYARKNRLLAAAFVQYLIARGNQRKTIRDYLGAVTKLTDFLGAASVTEVGRDQIRLLLSEWFDKGLSGNSLNLATAGLRAFFKFLKLGGAVTSDPMLLIGYRKLPVRVPRVLTLNQVEKLIDVGKNPLEHAIPEVLYSTGVRVNELVNLRFEDIQWSTNGPHSLRVHRGKGGKDRVVLFGKKAAEAIRTYQKWRPSKAGFLFEPNPKRPRRYTDRTITALIGKLGRRARLGHVHPHMLRRAMASHMLEHGANLRVIQDLLGHERLNTTMRYTSLTADHLQKIHAKFHPKGNANAKKK